MDWREMLRPGDWVVLNSNEEAVIIGQRDNAYWVEVAADNDSKYIMVQRMDIIGVSKDLEHWFLAV